MVVRIDNTGPDYLLAEIVVPAQVLMPNSVLHPKATDILSLLVEEAGARVAETTRVEGGWRYLVRFKRSDGKLRTAADCKIALQNVLAAYARCVADYDAESKALPLFLLDTRRPNAASKLVWDCIEDPTRFSDRLITAMCEWLTPELAAKQVALRAQRADELVGAPARMTPRDAQDLVQACNTRYQFLRVMNLYNAGEFDAAKALAKKYNFGG